MLKQFINLKKQYKTPTQALTPPAEKIGKSLIKKLLRQGSGEVGQAGCKASWVQVPNCAHDFINAMAVVE